MKALKFKLFGELLFAGTRDEFLLHTAPTEDRGMFRRDGEKLQSPAGRGSSACAGLLNSTYWWVPWARETLHI